MDHPRRLVAVVTSFASGLPALAQTPVTAARAAAGERLRDAETMAARDAEADLPRSGA